MNIFKRLFRTKKYLSISKYRARFIQRMNEEVSLERKRGLFFFDNWSDKQYLKWADEHKESLHRPKVFTEFNTDLVTTLSIALGESKSEIKRCQRDLVIKSVGREGLFDVYSFHKVRHIKHQMIYILN